MGPEGQQAVDVEALVAEIREEANELRAGLRAPEDARTRFDAKLDRLREDSDPSRVQLRSHRGRVGGPILAVKRLLIRLLTPVWEQQTTFGEGTVDRLRELGETLRAAARDLGRRVDDLDRRLVAVEDALARGGETPKTTDPGFDYESFERQFRGSPEQIRASQRPYLDLFAAGDGPVLDLGCGEGIFLGLLRDRGLQARGVDLSQAAIARCRAEGLQATQGDLLPALESCPDRSLGAVVSFQVVEHLTLPVVLRVIRVARQKIRPGGLLLIETVNLASLVVFARAWTLDPTHRQPLHPLTLRFLVEQAGFSRVELRYSAEVEPETRLEIAGGGGPEARNAAVLNDVVFGPQNYAVVARA